MKHRKAAALLAALSLILMLCGCGGTDGQESASGAQVTVTDMIGRDVLLVPGSYERIVCIGAGALRMYSYVGDISLLCGVEDIDNESLSERPKMFDGVARPYVLAYGENFEKLPSCGVGGPSAQTAEAEKILSCNPDLVISAYEDVEKAEALQAQLGVPVITLKAGADGVFDGAFSSSLRLLGTVLGREERAESLIRFVEAQTNELRETCAAVKDEDRPTVYICGLGNWGTTNHLMSAADYAPFRIANINNALSGTGVAGVQTVEEEKFVSLGASMDIMIIDAAAVKNIVPLYREDGDLFTPCKAWQNAQVYLQMAFNAYYTNYELALINTWFIAKTVYPDLFAHIDIAEKTDEITSAFLGSELGEKIFACPGSYGGYGRIDTATFFK